MSHIPWPEFDALPLDQNGPPGNAWGLFGQDDQLGMLNLLTPEVVAAAAAEIKHGIRISLDWPLNKPGIPTDGRKLFHHRIIHHPDIPMNDDEVHLNTQSSTQWDGFRHFGIFRPSHVDRKRTLMEIAYQSTKQFFNGHQQDDFQDPEKLGIDSA